MYRKLLVITIIYLIVPETATDPADFFLHPKHPVHRRYEALRAYFVDDLTAAEVEKQFGYAKGYVRLLATQFRQGKTGTFFVDVKPGRHTVPTDASLKEGVLELRKQNMSVYDIAAEMRRSGRDVSHQTVWRILKEVNAERLPKRTAVQKASPRRLPLQKADMAGLNLTPGRVVACRAPLLFLFASQLERLGFDSLVQAARYPSTPRIHAQSYLRALLGLKLLFVPRRNHVMPLAEDEGLGIWAGLNVLPKTTALSDYSYLMGPKHHRSLLHGIVEARHLEGAYPTLSFNLDFHMIRHYGDTENSMLEKDYVPRRSQSVPSVVTAFAQESVSREMVYVNANLLKKEKADEAVAFVEYWKEVTGKLPGELVVDARVTTHKGLRKLDDMGITFITLRERRKGEIERILSTPADKWERVELGIKDRKWKTPLILDEMVELPDYGEIRQVAATDYGKEQPTLLITNDRRRGAAALLTRYARRTLIENSLGEQVHFFHVDALSSSVRIKVDMDVVLSVIASGCYTWLAKHLKGYESATARTIWETFLDRRGTVEIREEEIVLRVRRFSRAPVLLESQVSNDQTSVGWLGGRRVRLEITRGEPNC